MTEVSKTKKVENKSESNTIAVAVTSAVVGAGIALAGVAALQNEDTRNKAKKIVKHAKDQAVSYVEDMQKQVQEKAAEETNK